MPTPTPRIRTNDPEGLRRRLVDAAYDAFTTVGYHATSLHHLKEGVQASGGALSHHFPAKRDLGLAVLRDRVAPAVEDAWVAPVALARTAAEGVQAAIAAVADALDAQGRVHGCPLNNLALEMALADPEFRTEIAAVFTHWQATIADKLRDDVANVLAPTAIDADGLATLVVASYSGAMAMAKAHQHSQPLRQCAAQLARIDGLRA